MRSAERPLIEVTGVITHKEAKGVADVFRRTILPGSSHQGAVGYLSNCRTLERIGRQSLKFPNLEALPNLLSQTGDVARNVIHYNSHEVSSLHAQITKLYRSRGIYDEGLSRTLQLNIRWPELQQLEAIKENLPDLKIILPVTSRILTTHNREQIAEQLAHYGDHIDFILIDPSGGRGKKFDTNWSAQYYRLFKDEFPDKQIIFAGGFDNENVSTRLPQMSLAFMSLDFGIDSESGLRVPDTNTGYGRLSLSKVNEYVEKSTTFFSSTSRAFAGTE